MPSPIADFIRARGAEVYAEPRTEGHDDITAQMAEIVARLLPAGAQVLDVGCGQGPALEWFSAHGFRPMGITTSGEDWKKCHLTLGLNARIKDMHELGGFPEKAFDGIWARHVLEHSPVPFYVLHEFARILRPAGVLYVEVPAPDTACNHEANPNHYSVFGWRMWASLIHRAGFEHVESREIKLHTGAGPDLYFSFIAKKL